MVKDISITEKVKEKIKNGYYIEVEFMFGDADGYTTKEMGPFSEEEKMELIDAVETIQRCIDEYADTGRGGLDDYDHIKGFDKWFSDEIESPNQAISMVYEPNGCGIQASFDNYSVYYYDNGEKYNCEIIFEN